MPEPALPIERLPMIQLSDTSRDSTMPCRAPGSDHGVVRDHQPARARVGIDAIVMLARTSLAAITTSSAA